MAAQDIHDKSNDISDNDEKTSKCQFNVFKYCQVF